MSQHKKQEKPTQVVGHYGEHTLVSKVLQTTRNPFTITDPTELKQLLKAIYRDGATGTSRSLSKDLQTITDLFKEQA